MFGGADMRRSNCCSFRKLTMMTHDEFKMLALSIDRAVSASHFSRIAFKAGNKRIFASLDEVRSQATFKLSETDQSVFCAFDKKFIYPVPGKWGKKGWTVFHLERLPSDLIEDALSLAHREVALS